MAAYEGGDSGMCYSGRCVLFSRTLLEWFSIVLICFMGEFGVNFDSEVEPYT